MENIYILVPILLPIIAGALLFFFPIKERKARNIAVETLVILNSILSLTILWAGSKESLMLFELYKNVSILFRIDGLGMLFGTLISGLWPLATLYAFEYMTHETRENTFFAFYTMTYGVSLGIAYAGNMMTMYLFYELLTLVTIPLVMHTMIPRARRAGRQYAYYSIGGAAFAFTSLIFITVYGEGASFAIGGVMDHTLVDDNILRLIYVMAFLGFGVKAAVFPLHGWLISASVAPTPVTALLHAVAVVKAGVFAILRLTYYCYGTEILKGSWAQTIVMVIAMFTVVYGSTMAVKEVHFKRRLAYSTISNLSYILMAATLMSPLGMIAAMCHIVAHAIGKICAFFVSGSVMFKTEYHFIPALDGVGLRMKKTFLTFVVSAMSLTGIPLTIGFISKWRIAKAAFAGGTPLSYGVVLVLLYAAVMAAIYMFTVVVRAFCPEKGKDRLIGEETTDPTWRMLVPLGLFAAAMVFLGVNSRPLLQFLEQIAAGLI